MASTYTGLGTELMTTGENAGTWGTTTNTNLQIIEQISGGYVEQSIAGGTQTTTLSVSDGSTGATLGHRIIKFTGTITGNQTVTIPLDVQQMYVLVNGTSGAYTVNFKYVSGSGNSVTFATTDKGTKLVYAAADHASNPNLVDTGISTNSLTGVTGDITIDSPADIILDADGANVTIKDGGTTILDFVANGATDVTLDAPGDIKLDADGGDVFFVDGGTTFGSATNTSGNLILKSGTTTALTFSGANVTGSGTFEATTITASTAVVPDASDGATIGSASLEWSDLYLADGGVIYFGDDQEITLTHAADDGLILKHVGTADGKEPSLTFQAGDTDIAADDVLGSIFFQAPDEGAGTDAILVAAGIEAVSEGDFSSSNNATKLSFKTGASEAATEKVTISSAGNLNLVSSNTELRFYEGANYVGFEAPALSGDQIWVLPTADGSSGQQLTTDGSGTLSWAAATSATAADDISTGDAAVTIATSAGNITIDAQAGDTDIIFKGTDSAADITALTLDMSDAGTAIFNNDISLDSDSAVLKFGDDQEITLTHEADVGLKLKHTATADDKPIVLTLQTGETDLAQDDVIGKIAFQAPDESQGTDAVLISAAIQARAEGDHSSSSNASSIDFMTGASEAATKKLSITSAGHFIPGTDNTYDIGTSSLEFKDGYFDGTLHCDVLDLNGTEHTSIEDPTALAIALG